MREVKCFKCGKGKMIEDNIVISLCPVCVDVEMKEVVGDDRG